MKLQLIRNATVKMHYGGRVILVDPFFSPKHAIDSFVGVSRNPTVDLPFSPVDVMEGVDTVLITHLHPDHFDPVAQALVPKASELLCQGGDEVILGQIGFSNTVPVIQKIDIGGVSLTPTPGSHGTGQWAQQMGKVSGFIFEAPGEPKIYLAGDTIYYDEIQNIINQHNPEIVITNSGGAEFPGSGPIIMNAEQTILLADEYPQATVVAIHLESLDHCTVSRSGLREHARLSNIPDERLLIPNDGEILEF